MRTLFWSLSLLFSGYWSNSRYVSCIFFHPIILFFFSPKLFDDEDRVRMFWKSYFSGLIWVACLWEGEGDVSMSKKKKMKEALFFDPFKKMIREYLVSRYAFDGRIFLFIFFLKINLYHPAWNLKDEMVRVCSGWAKLIIFFNINHILTSLS